MIVFAAAEVVAEAVAETVLLKVDIGSKQVQEVSAAARPLEPAFVSVSLHRFGFVLL